jgi:NADH dehydrogenase FAD-containing subunit
MRAQGMGEENREVQHVVIVGGGFAGLNCAKKLAKHPESQIYSVCPIEVLDLDIIFVKN